MLLVLDSDEEQTFLKDFVEQNWHYRVGMVYDGMYFCTHVHDTFTFSHFMIDYCRVRRICILSVKVETPAPKN